MLTFILICMVGALIFTILFREEIRAGIGYAVIFGLIGVVIYLLYESFVFLQGKITTVWDTSPGVFVFTTVLAFVLFWIPIREFLRSRKRRRENIGFLPDSGTDRADDSISP